MRIISSLSLILLLLLTACAVQPVTSSVSLPEAQATYQQAAAQASRQAAMLTATPAAATAQAAAVYAASTATAQTQQQQAAATSTAIADSLNAQATRYAIEATATYSAIMAGAIATDEAQKAQFAIAQAGMETARLALQNQAERERQQRARVMTWVWVGIAVAVIGAALAIVGAVVRRMGQLSQPVMMANGQVALPAGAYQMPAIRTQRTADEPLPQIAPPQTLALPPLTTGHALIAGETGSGKSTAMKAVIANRGNVVILDPHDTPGEWGNHRVIGGGRNYEAVGEYLENMRRELRKRYELRARGQAMFDPLTVCTDEMPSIVDNCGRVIDATWREWLREGRKVGLFFVTSSQSKRVKTLGIKGEGDLLENFTYVLVLGKLAMAEYRDIVQGMERPAVLHTVEGVRPVTIPYQPQQIPPPQVNMGPREISTRWGIITPEQVAQILHLYREGESQRSIETAVFGHHGGAAYHKVNAVLESASGPAFSG